MSATCDVHLQMKTLQMLFELIHQISSVLGIQVICRVVAS